MGLVPNMTDYPGRITRGHDLSNTMPEERRSLLSSAQRI